MIIIMIIILPLKINKRNKCLGSFSDQVFWILPKLNKGLRDMNYRVRKLIMMHKVLYGKMIWPDFM